MDTRWLTYDEIGQLLGIAPDSARRLVARRKWARKAGNDGRARIAVPLDKLPVSSPDVGADALPDVSPDVRPDVIPDKPDTAVAVVEMLMGRVKALEDELRQVKAERDIEHERAGQVQALQAVLDVERGRVAEWQAVADRWAAQAERLAQGGRRRWWPFG